MNKKVVPIALISSLCASALFVQTASAFPPGEDRPEPPTEESEGPGDRPEQPMREGGKHRRGERMREFKERRGEAQERFGMLKGRERFLKFSKEYYDTVRDPHAAIGFAALGIREKFRREGKPEAAVPELQKLLEGAKDQGARNVLLFTIRQIHESSKNTEAFTKVNDQILRENLAAVNK